METGESSVQRRHTDDAHVCVLQRGPRLRVVAEHGGDK